MPKISEMTEATSLDGSEQLYTVQQSNDCRLEPEQLGDYIANAYVFNSNNTNNATVAGKLNSLTTSLLSINSLMDKIYPVGAIYWSTKSTSPATYFGGTWSQIKDRFILCAGNNHPAGQTGGADKVALTIAEMPSHDHEGTTDKPSSNTTGGCSISTGNNSASHNHSIPALSGSTNETGAHTHSISAAFVSSGSGGWSGGKGTATTGTLSSPGHHQHTGSTTASKTNTQSANHSHSLQNHTHTLSSHTHSITANGSGTAHNNMPPYIVYYCWERTA